jgi:hypothetical protein
MIFDQPNNSSGMCAIAPEWNLPDRIQCVVQFHEDRRCSNCQRQQSDKRRKHAGLGFLCTFDNILNDPRSVTPGQVSDLPSELALCGFLPVNKRGYSHNDDSYGSQ